MELPILSELSVLSELKDVPIGSSTVPNKRYVFRAWMVTYLGFLPIIPLLIHLIITVNMSSDCDTYDTESTEFYLLFMHILTFLFEAFVALPDKSVGSIKLSEWGIVAFKAGAKTLQFWNFSLLRAKPYKCLGEYSPGWITVLTLVIQSVGLGGSWIVTRETIG